MPISRTPVASAAAPATPEIVNGACSTAAGAMFSPSRPIESLAPPPKSGRRQAAAAATLSCVFVSKSLAS